MKDTADNLASSKSHILKLWEEQVRRTLPGAKHESRPALRDHIPDFLDYLTEALRFGISSVRPEIVSFAHHHGAERALLSSYTVEEALGEYNILRKVIFRELETYRPITPDERDIIYEAINLGLSKAAAEYTDMQLRRIEKSEQKFRLLFSHAPVGIAEVDNEEIRFTRVNPKYCEMLGYTEEEFIKLKVSDVTLPEDLPEDVEKLKLLKQGKIKGYRREKRYVKKDGTIIWAEISVTSFHSADLEVPFNIAVAIDITDRKIAEEKLRVIQDRFERATSYSHVGVWELDIKTKNIWRNEKHDELFGYKKSADKWTTDLYLSHVHPEDRKCIEQELRKATEIPGRHEWECRVVWPDKSIHWLVLKGETIVDENGRPSKMFGTNYDITDGKSSETMLKESTRRLQQIADIQPLLIGQVGEDYKYKFVNDAYEKWFGIPKKQIVGKPVWDVIGKEAFEDVADFFKRAFTGERVIAEKKLKYKHRGETSVMAVYSPELDETGKVLSVFISVFDVSEQRKILEELQKSEQDFRNLADALPQLVWIADADGRINWYNQRWTDFSGKGIDELEKDGWLSIHHPDYYEKGMAKYCEHMLSGKIWEDTFPMRSKSGEWRWFLSRAIPVKSATGEIRRWIGTNTDITDQKKILDALREETVLRQKFVSTLTHDLRTPLTAAKMSADLIKRKSSDDTLINLSVRISDNLNRANVMIEDLLDASKIRAGQALTPVIQNFNLTDLLEKTLEDLTSIHGDRFVLSAPDELMVWLDPNGIRRVLENLCTNAIKYGSPHENIRIKLEHGTKRLMICVHNEGNPLMNIDKTKLFEPFQRGPDHFIAGKKGWGIGLTIVKGITEAHQGEVSVDSSEEGTTFKILLPIDARINTDDHQRLSN